ncbi:hypothetical protein Trydic_g421 [Trypoxylus dichotomus]
MSTFLLSLPDLFDKYKNWIIRNPEKANDFETTAKWISYFVAGRINNSHAVSELIYALSNLLVLFNDRLITKGRQLEKSDDSSRLKIWLTVIEYSEVFLEISSNKIFGNRGRWVIIVSIQIFKCLTRLALICHYKESIITVPSVPALDRIKLNTPELRGDISDSENPQLKSVSFSLKRSGKVIRKIDASPSISGRNWKPLQVTQSDLDECNDQAMIRRKQLAEVIYVSKPLAHLGVSAIFGYNTWKPWMVSLVMDILSLQLYRSCTQGKVKTLTKKQRLQLSRRTFVMLLYLLRSPFYERYTRQRVEGALNCLGNKVPLMGLICSPVLRYLPFWQTNYFYMWST